MHSASVSHTRSTALILAAYDACIDTQHNQQMSNLYVVAQKVIVIDIMCLKLPSPNLGLILSGLFLSICHHVYLSSMVFLDYPLVARNVHCCNTSVVQSVRASFLSSLFCQPVLLVCLCVTLRIHFSYYPHMPIGMLGDISFTVCFSVRRIFGNGYLGRGLA